MPAVKNGVQARTSNVQARAGTRVIGKNAAQAHNPICGFKNIRGKRGGVATTLGKYSIVFPMAFQSGSELCASMAAMISSGQVLKYWHEFLGHGLDCDSGAPLISIFIVAEPLVVFLV